MDVLVIGGTRFLGRHVVDEALARGDTVTLLHRGSTVTHRPGAVTEVLADRIDVAAALDGPLAGRGFDAVIDTCGYHPAEVAVTASALRTRTGRYLFVSSVSAYADLSQPGVTEDRPLAVPPHPLPSAATPEHYGALKAACEAVVRDVFGDRAVLVRPGLIVGPFDPTDRFTYWALRREDPGPVLAPAVPDAPVQVVHARDLAAFCLDVAGAGDGAYNATGAPGLRFADLVAGCEVVWAPEQFLLDHGVVPWTGLPLWIPTGSDAGGLLAVDVTRARTAGLRCRPLPDTLTDTVAWARRVQQRPGDQAGTTDDSAVLSRGRERELLALLAGTGR